MDPSIKKLAEEIEAQRANKIGKNDINFIEEGIKLKGEGGRGGKKWW